ncbi:MAG: hypothetical protein CL693_19435 [Cellvibrionaceae bacterium]|nr:hypothetical protein [Cellvibrionaceae bacterium]|tara:strand:- start:136544 stop:137041 length:498 start_codon:yes stop_codon:yes gene_type:complete
MIMRKVIFFVSLCLVSSVGVGMSILDVGKVCTFSAVSGVITKDGQPVRNARIVRVVDFQSKSQDETTTDEHGRFSMPALFERSITKLLPQEFVVGQSLLIEDGGDLQEFHMGVKRQSEENVESKGVPLDVICELSDENSAFYIDGNAFVTKCKWDAEHDVIDTGF